MAHYLLVYDRKAGRLLREESFDSRLKAMQARFAAEKKRPASDVEIVVLSAATHDDLRRTHSRYFRSLAELAGNRS